MEGNAQNDAIEKIKQYANESRRLREQEMDVDSTDQAGLEARLDHTIRELQERLKKQQLQLDELRAKSTTTAPTAPSADPMERLIQLRTIKAAYEKMTPEKPNMPTPGSLLPTLLATRIIQQTIGDTKANITATQSQLETTELQLSREENQLSDAKLLTTSLEARTTRLGVEQQTQLSQSSTAKAKDLIHQKQKRKQTFQLEANKLQQSLDQFIEEHLSAMLAAEELGGPVVGELIDVNEDMLTAGFSSQGKPKATTKSSAQSDDKRQRRIDEIWGSSKEERTEKDAAADEIRELLEELLKDGGGGYVQLGRESAAARFLVRAKVAVFNPKDARKLRLVDFGRELGE